MGATSLTKRNKLLASNSAFVRRCLWTSRDSMMSGGWFPFRARTRDGPLFVRARLHSMHCIGAAGALEMNICVHSVCVFGALRQCALSEHLRKTAHDNRNLNLPDRGAL